ncbi:hypothetical protein [Streptomyces sp. NPDC060194]|uniref:hypothetical protein n=1 Tax=Streptomyces sp. NPDC060194 TaxID=3347069 RepID=UPI00366991C5
MSRTTTAAALAAVAVLLPVAACTNDPPPPITTRTTVVEPTATVTVERTPPTETRTRTETSRETVTATQTRRETATETRRETATRRETVTQRETVTERATETVPVAPPGQPETSPPETPAPEPPPEDSPSAEESPSAEDTGGTTSAPGDQPLALTDTATYGNGVEVTLSGFERGTSTDSAAPENTALVRFDLRIVNNSSETVTPSELSVSCAYGAEGRAGEQVFDTAAGLDGPPDTSLLAGRSVTVPIACTLPPEETFVQIEISPDHDSGTAVFAGEVP